MKTIGKTKFKISTGNATLPAILLACVLATAGTASAQFTINGSTTTGQTLTSGTGTVTSTGTLSVAGSTAAVTISSATNATTTLSNSGTIRQTGSGRAVQSASNSGTILIQNNVGALISSTNNDTIAIGQGSTSVLSVTLTNDGTINSAAGGQAVNFNKILTATNSVINTGTITATNSDAVRTGVNGSVNNSGLIKSIDTGTGSSDGVDAQTNSGFNVTNSGVIEGARHGITGGNTTAPGTFSGTITNNAGGLIQADNGGGINIDGLNGNETVTILNSGTIIGAGYVRDGDGVDVDGVVSLTNNGLIRSLNAFNDTSEGVTVGGGTIINTGTIQGSVISGSNGTGVGRGITLAGIDPGGPIYGNSSITNSGLIKGDTDSGIVVTGSASGFTVLITNNAGGVIEGGGTAAAAIQTGLDNDTIVNSGTIIADASGKAIDMGGGNDTLKMLGGSITGDVSGGSGTNSLIIDPGTGKSISYSGAISNFNSVAVNSGTATLSGSSTYSGSTTVTGGKLSVNGSIANSAVTVNSGGVLGGSGTSGAVTVNNGGKLSPGNSPGTYTAPSLVVNGGGTYVAEIVGGTSAPVAGTSYDQTILTGTGNILSLDKTANTGSILQLNVSGILRASGISSNANPYSATGPNNSLDNYFIIKLQDGGATIDATNSRFAVASDGVNSVTINYDSNEFSASNPNGVGTFTLNGQEWAISYKANAATNSTSGGHDIAVTAIPEPGTYAMIAGGFAMLFIYRRRTMRFKTRSFGKVS